MDRPGDRFTEMKKTKDLGIARNYRDLKDLYCPVFNDLQKWSSGNEGFWPVFSQLFPTRLPRSGSEFSKSPAPRNYRDLKDLYCPVFNDLQKWDSENDGFLAVSEARFPQFLAAPGILPVTTVI